MKLAPARKLHGGGVHRTVAPAQTWQRIRGILGRIGVTRMCDITGLDRIGIPTFSCVRPTAQRFSVTVTCGKGLRPIDAKVGAAMEAIEYYCAEQTDQACIVGRVDELRGRAVDPVDLLLPEWAEKVSSSCLQWLEGWDLVADAPTWVPANAVFFPYEPRQWPYLFRPNTNGLASGNTLEEAICHALAELIERDAWSIACARLRTAQCERISYPSLDPRSVPPEAARLMEAFRKAGVELYVRVITSDVGVPVFYASSIEKQDDTHFLAHEGMGAHPDATVALLRAITEVAQSRAADIQGSREDLTFWRARALKQLNGGEWIFQESDRITFDEINTRETADVMDDIRYMLSRLGERGLRQVVAVDLTRSELGIPVVRVVLPGLEVLSIDPWRIGARIRGELGIGERKPAPVQHNAEY
jgi:thioglycine synthase